VSLFLRREAARLPPPLPVESVEIERRDRRREPENPTRGWDRAVIFRVNLGAEAKAEPGWLLPLICRRGGVTRREVGSIRVGPRSSTFEIAADAATAFALAAREVDPRAPQVSIERVNAAPQPVQQKRKPQGRPPHPRRV